MANVRKSTDGRKRARTMEYIDREVDINDEEASGTSPHVGQHIRAHIDVSMSVIDETNASETPLLPMIRPIPSIPKFRKRDSERSLLQRQMSDISLNHLINDTNKTTTELKGRDHVLRAMKTANSKPTVEFKNSKFIQEMIAKRQEKQETNRPISDFALKYGLIDHTGKQSKSRKTSELIADISQQFESLKSTVTKRQPVDPQSPLLKIVKLDKICNYLLCYCQYVTDREDLVLFLDPNDEQAKTLSIHDCIRVAGEDRHDMNLPDLGSVVLGITDVRKELNCSHDDVTPMETNHTYDFQCSCNKCTPNSQATQVSSTNMDLLSAFPDDDEGQQRTHSVEIIYESFTLALMSKRKFDLRGTIIIYEPDLIRNRYIFIVRDGIGNCLQIVLTDITGLPIEIRTRNYIFHQIEFFERIESPKESNCWPYDDYKPPKKLFCFRSLNNHVSLL